MLKYLREVFSSDGNASFARYTTVLTVLTGSCCLVYVVVHNGALPDATALVGLGAWMTAPYAINKASAALSLHGDETPGTLPDVHASAVTPHEPLLRWRDLMGAIFFLFVFLSGVLFAFTLVHTILWSPVPR